MTLPQIRFLLACIALTGTGAAHAALYGKVNGDRVSVIYSDRQPADPGYTLYAQGNSGGYMSVTGGRQNRFIVLPGAWKKAPRGADAPVAAPAPSIYDSHIEAAATESNVDAALIRAVISVESGFNPSARSPKGAMGLMQLMPDTARKYGVKNIRDPAQNIQGGARYLGALMAMFGNDVKLVLAAYNAGEEAVMKYGRRIPPYAETTAYVPKVLSRYKKTAPVTTGG